MKNTNYFLQLLLLSSFIQPPKSSQLNKHLGNLVEHFNKSFHMPFTLWKNNFPTLQLQGEEISTMNQVKYLGISFHKIPTWGPHLKSKHKIFNNRLYLIKPILKFKLSIYIKSTMFKCQLRSICAYGIQIWVCAKLSQVRTTIQTSQFITL